MKKINELGEVKTLVKSTSYIKRADFGLLCKSFLLMWVLLLPNLSFASSGYNFSQRSLHSLEFVHPDLQKVAHRALELTKYDFIVTDGLRDLETQKLYVKKGVSQTLKSKHLEGLAIDIAVIVDGKVTWEFGYYREVSRAFKEAAKELDIEIRWGGDWPNFKDAPHFELSNQ